MKRIKFLLFIFSICVYTIFSYEIPKELVFVGARPKSDTTVQWLIKIESEAFARLGIAFKYLDVPPKRAIYDSENGFVDGDIGRIYDYSEVHPNLIRVEENVLVQNFSAFSTDENLKLSGWKSLENSNLLIERRDCIKGVKSGLEALHNIGPVSVAKSLEMGLIKLKLNRTDLFIDARDYVLKYIKSPKFKELDMKLYEAGVMQSITSHIHLHKKHKELIPLLEKELKEMKREGRFEYHRERVGLEVSW